MDRLDTLICRAESLGIVVDFSLLAPGDALDGLFLQWADGRAVILINRHRPVTVQTVALAEELGHFLKTVGNTLPMSTPAQRKGEMAGRAWSYRALLPPAEIRHAVRSGISTVEELADAVSLPGRFVSEAIHYYQRKRELPLVFGWCEVI